MKERAPLPGTMKPAAGWALAIGAGVAGGLALLAALLAALGPTTVTALVHAHGACGSGALAGEPDAPGATRLDLAVRDGERFTVPVPEDARPAAGYSLAGDGNVTLARALPDGSPDLGPRGQWAGLLGGCASSAGPRGELGPFVARGNGTVRALVWPAA